MNRLSAALLALALSGAGAPAGAATVVTFHAPSHAVAGGVVPVRLEFRETAGGPLPEVISFQLTVSGSARFQPNPRKGRVIGGAGTSAIFARAEDGVFDIDISTPVAEAIRFVFADSSGEGIAPPTRTIFSDGV